ncbi:MAG: helix-turn-helix domain-containing protein [Actinomycetota bacterium]
MPELRNVAWAPAESGAAFELLDRAVLFERVDDALLVRTEWLEFHLIVVVRAGIGTHEVDLVEVELVPGRVLHVSPGQIHRWQSEPEYDAWLVICPDVPVATADAAVGPRIRDLGEAAMARIAALASLVDAPIESAAHPVHSRALRDLLYVELGLADIGPDAVPPDSVYGAYRRDIEDHLDAGDSVAARAVRLGYSTRTLTRACQRVTGRTAKQELDARLALEARRRLAVPGVAVGEVSRRLGFTETSNFAKFVRRTTGRAPSAWRSA